MIKKILYITALFVFAFTNICGNENITEVSPGIFAKIETTKGIMIFDLDYKNAPLTTLNFINLVDKGFYNNLKFYRNIENYAIFSGDPNNDGTSSIDYNFPMELNEKLSHDKSGILTMDGISGQSNGSRFFISKSADTVLDEKYSSFGFITEGLKVLNKLKRDDSILSIEIIKNGADALTFETSKEEFGRLSKLLLDKEMESFKEENQDIANLIESLGEGVNKSLSGVYFLIIKEGTGEKVSPGDIVSLHYTGKFVDGTVFDSSLAKGVPVEFSIGTKSIISGMDESILDMSIGEKRIIVIPPSLAYGEQRTGPIPPNSWLVFEIELIDIK